MKFSLILPTLGRKEELIRFFNSLKKQTYKNFEVIVVDQNHDKRVYNLLSDYSKCMNINYNHVLVHGLSKARNIGLKEVTGDIVAFADDDRWYFPNTLQVAKNLFEKYKKLEGITGTPLDDSFRPLLPSLPADGSLLDQVSVWKAGISITIFLRAQVVNEIGLFDEGLGVGADTPYGSGEETDYLLRILEKGGSIKYFSDVKVGHPNKSQGGDRDSIKRCYSYGCGLGYVLKKHDAPINQRIKVLIRPAGGALLALFRGNIHLAGERIGTFLGRIYGLLS